MLAFFDGLLAVGTIWFWLFAFAVVAVITALVENDEGAWATLVFVGTVLSLQFFSKIPILNYMKRNPGHTLVYVGIYFAIGIAWTLVKWYFFVHNQIVKYNEFKRAFLKGKGADTLTPALAAELADEATRLSGYDRNVAAAPDPANHKSDLTRWGTYWPFSMIGTALNDIIRKAWEYVYEILQTTYQRMSKAVFKTAEADFKMAQEYKAQQAATGRSIPRRDRD
jgi:hypothetical protein